MSVSLSFVRSAAAAHILARSSVIALAVAAAPAAFAQDSADAAEAPAAADIVVTGSRIARRDFSSDSPITTVGQDAIKNTGQLTLDKSLSQLPQFGLGENSTQTGYNTSGQASVNMRGLGTFRNLVLLDGRRMQPSNIQQVVDLNTIPTALIESIEVITGGASAVYGSDAIAGVVNVRTKQKFEGLKLDAQYGITEQGDGATSDISLTAGTNFAGGRGNVVVSGSYSHRDTINYQSRSFFRKNEGGTDLRLPTGVYAPGSNRPSQAALDALFAQYGVAAGSVVPASGISFNDDGTLFSASNGVFNYRGSQGGLLYSTGNQVNNLNTFLTLQSPLERYSAFGRATFDITDSVTAFAEANYSRYDTTILVEPGNASLSIPVNNVFIPADLQALLASRADPNANLTLEKRFHEAGPRVTERRLDMLQVTAGLRGKLSGLDGSWEIYGSHGRTKIDERSPGSVLKTSLASLINAADGGQSICAGGYNPFGVNPLSAECYAYLVASPERAVELEQDVIEANLQGRLFALPGGDARFAVGAAYRRNSYSSQPDAILSAGNVVGVPFTSASEGESNVKEGYVELFLPLIADKPFIHRLEASFGYRYSDYNLAGGVHTYKAEGNWQPVESFRIRGGYARAVRAPSVGELFVAPSGSTPGLGRVINGQGDPCHGANPIHSGPNAAAIRALCVAQGVPDALVDGFVNLQDDSNATSVGNLGLKPEKADTFTLGATFNPRSSSPWLSGLALSVDYYDIRLKGAIGVVSSLQSVQKCFNLDGSNPNYAADNFFCANIERDPTTGRIENVLQPTLNLGGYKTRGIDFQLDYRLGLDALGASDRSSIGLNSVVTYLDTFKVQTTPGGNWAEYAGTVGGTSTSQPGSLPKWKAVTTLDYRAESFTLGGRWRFIDSMKAAARATNPASTTPGVPSYSLFDLFGELRVTPDYTLRAGINNLANKQPLVLNGVIGTTEASTYDVIGRSFYVALSAKF